MAGLVPAIHVLLPAERKTWMPGTSPAMTSLWDDRSDQARRTCSVIGMCDSAARKRDKGRSSFMVTD